MRRQLGNIAVQRQHDDFLARHLDQLAGGLVGDQLAVVDDGDALAQLFRLLEVMGGEHHRHPGGVHFLDQLPQLAAQFDIDAGSRLVEHQHRRRMDQRLGDQQPPLHPARERARIGLRLVLKMDRAQQFHRAPQRLGDAVEPGGVLQHLDRGEKRIEHDLLRHDADRALGVAHVGIDIEAPDRRRAGGLHHHPGKNIDQRRLARTIGPEQPEDAALGDIETDPVKREMAFAAALGCVALDQVAD